MSITLFEPLTKPTAAQLNAIGDDQVTLDALYPGVTSRMGAEEVVGSAVWGFLHLYRWLLYNSTGELVDPTAVNDPVSLSDPDLPTDLGILDLDTVDWLAVGVYYRVTGCAVAWEAEAAPSA